MADRREQIAGNLQVVHARIDAAATAASRGQDEVTLVVVTKTWPASDVRLLAELGVSHIGENRDQEAAPKAAALADVAVQWHFIGQLQTNKVKSVAGYADVVESVDRERLITVLDRAASDTQRTLNCLIQVGLDRLPGRGGAPIDRVGELAEAIVGSQSLTLGGVMAVAPLAEDPFPAFERLARVSAELRRSHPGARTISAGMSGDLEAAVACGATHVRVGSAVLGQRPPVG